MTIKPPDENASPTISASHNGAYPQHSTPEQLLRGPASVHNSGRLWHHPEFPQRSTGISSKQISVYKQLIAVPTSIQVLILVPSGQAVGLVDRRTHLHWLQDGSIL